MRVLRIGRVELAVEGDRLRFVLEIADLRQMIFAIIPEEGLPGVWPVGMNGTIFWRDCA